MIVTIEYLDKNVPMVEIKGRGWFPSRPLNWSCRSFSERIKESWMVFTGKADPFVWPENEHLSSK